MVCFTKLEELLIVETGNQLVDTIVLPSCVFVISEYSWVESYIVDKEVFTGAVAVFLDPVLITDGVVLKEEEVKKDEEADSVAIANQLVNDVSSPSFVNEMTE